jgi:hypothetical protein
MDETHGVAVVLDDERVSNAEGIDVARSEVMW